MIDENFDWKAFEKSEVGRVLSEIEAIEQAEGNVAACENHSGEATVEAFAKAADSIVDIFAEKTRSLR